MSRSSRIRWAWSGSWLALLFNAAHDVLDFGAIIVPLIRKQGIRRPALMCLAFATSGIVRFGSAWWFS